MIARGTGWAVAVAVALAAGPALAKDLLPLSEGLYVREGVACKDPARADFVAYPGGRAGLHIPPLFDCKFIKLAKSGSTYTLNQNCYDAQASETSDMSISFQAPIQRQLSSAGTIIATAVAENKSHRRVPI
jgi:hypothetical protein